MSECCCSDVCGRLLWRVVSVRCDRPYRRSVIVGAVDWWGLRFCGHALSVGANGRVCILRDPSDRGSGVSAHQHFGVPTDIKHRVSNWGHPRPIHPYVRACVWVIAWYRVAVSAVCSDGPKLHAGVIILREWDAGGACGSELNRIRSGNGCSGPCKHAGVCP